MPSMQPKRAFEKSEHSTIPPLRGLGGCSLAPVSSSKLMSMLQSDQNADLYFIVSL